MVDDKPTAKALRYAASQNKTGLQYYTGWEMEKAVDAFVEATTADPDNPEYHMNLARSYARNNNYQEAIRSLGEYLRTETDENIAARYERLFSSALDEVETSLIAHTREMDWPIQHTGKGIQMWLEYRITLGRRPLNIRRPDLWAAALTYAICKVNFSPTTRADVAGEYGISEKSLMANYQELVQVLDLMPADYRYFVGDENPLDKLVEAAQMLEDMYDRFRDE